MSGTGTATTLNVRCPSCGWWARMVVIRRFIPGFVCPKCRAPLVTVEAEED